MLSFERVLHGLRAVFGRLTIIPELCQPARVFRFLTIHGKSPVLLVTICVMLHFSRKILFKTTRSLNQCHFVTVLFLDKNLPVWQDIVEVKNQWHKILW